VQQQFDRARATKAGDKAESTPLYGDHVFPHNKPVSHHLAACCIGGSG
jgi:hypothetical protein